VETVGLGLVEGLVLGLVEGLGLGRVEGLALGLIEGEGGGWHRGLFGCPILVQDRVAATCLAEPWGGRRMTRAARAATGEAITPATSMKLTAVTTRARVRGRCDVWNGSIRGDSRLLEARDEFQESGGDAGSRNGSCEGPCGESKPDRTSSEVRIKGNPACCPPIGLTPVMRPDAIRSRIASWLTLAKNAASSGVTNSGVLLGSQSVLAISHTPRRRSLFRGVFLGVSASRSGKLDRMIGLLQALDGP